MDNKEIQIDEEFLLTNLDMALESDLIDIYSSTAEDLDALINAQVESAYEIANLNAQIAYVDSVIAKDRKRVNKYALQATLTADDLIEDIYSKRFIPIGFEKIIDLIVMMQVPTREEFTKRLALILLLNVLSFKINYDYFTSQMHRDKAKQNLRNARKRIEINHKAKDDLELCKSKYNIVLNAIVEKIYEVAPSEVDGIPFDDYFDSTIVMKSKIYTKVRNAEERAKRRKKKSEH